MNRQESNRLEFKRELSESFEREVVAFLNYPGGGTILLGVEDDGQPVGLDRIDELQLKIADRIKNNIKPATLGLFDVIQEEWQGKTILRIVVSGGMERPYYLRAKGMSESGCFLRVGSGVQAMPQEMIESLFARRAHTGLRMIRAPRQDLTFEQLRIYYEEHGHALNAQFRQTLELLTPEGAYNVVAYLLADENGTSIKVAKYAGTNKVDLIQNEEYGYCSLIKATKAVLQKFEIENITRAQITSQERIEKKLVDAKALREIIINAIVHNDYSTGVPPVFEIFSDRFMITSYGGLISGFSKEEFFACCSNPRNRELMRVYKDVELVEQLGSGMERILSVYDASIFEFTPNFMRVTLPFETEPDPPQVKEPAPKAVFPEWALKSLANRAHGGDYMRSEKILRMIWENPRISAREIALHLNLSDRTVRTELKQMKEMGILQHHGANKNGLWKIHSPEPGNNLP